MKKEIKIYLILILIFSVTNILFIKTIPPLGDEALLAIVGKHISEGKIFPYFVYGQPYNGAATIFSYLLADIFLLFGPNAVSYQIAMLILGNICLTLVYFFSLKHFNMKIALISGLLCIFPPMSIISLNRLYGDYLISIIINFLFVILFFKAIRTKKYFLLLGLLGAVAYYALEFFIPILFASCIVWFIKDRKFIRTKRFFNFLIGFILGSIPLLFYNITHNFENVKQLLAGTFIHKFVCNHNLVPKEVYFGSQVVNHCDIFNNKNNGLSFITLITKTFPDFFGLFFYIILLLLVGFFLYFLLQKKIKLKSDYKKQWFTIYLLIYISLFLFSRFSDTKHLLPIYPYILIVIAMLLNRISINKMLYSILLLLVLVSGLFNILNFQSDTGVVEVNKYLSERKIDYLYTPYSYKWGIIFASKEKIIASCENMCSCGASGMDSRYPLYEQLVKDSNTDYYLIPKRYYQEASTNETKILDGLYLIQTDNASKFVNCSLS